MAEAVYSSDSQADASFMKLRKPLVTAKATNPLSFDISPVTMAESFPSAASETLLSVDNSLWRQHSSAICIAYKIKT
jgi:hypothetical protein